VRRIVALASERRMLSFGLSVSDLVIRLGKYEYDACDVNHAGILGLSRDTRTWKQALLVCLQFKAWYKGFTGFWKKKKLILGQCVMSVLACFLLFHYIIYLPMNSCRIRYVSCFNHGRNVIDWLQFNIFKLIGAGLKVWSSWFQPNWTPYIEFVFFFCTSDCRSIYFETVQQWLEVTKSDPTWQICLIRLDSSLTRSDFFRKSNWSELDLTQTRTTQIRDDLRSNNLKPERLGNPRWPEIRQSKIRPDPNQNDPKPEMTWDQMTWNPTRSEPEQPEIRDGPKLDNWKPDPTRFVLHICI
jgi:hypothetical protein